MVQLRKEDQEQMEKAKDLMEAGPLDDLGLVRSLYFGQLRMDKVLPYPQQDPDEAQQIDELLAKLDAFMAEHLDPEQIDADELIPQHVIDGLGELGVLGMTVPREYGGGGFTHTAYCRVLERIAGHCASTAVMVGAHQSIGLKALVLNGTEEQKQRWLPDLATGRKLAAFCLSEPEVGSDASNVQTRAVLSDDGSEWIINGEKKYSTNGAIAGVMTVMAVTPIEIDGEIQDKVTAFVVTPDTPGFEVVSRNRSKMGVRGTWQATLKFTDMRIPRDQYLGELGRGLKVALTVLDYGRCTLSAGCLGGAKRALEMATEHVLRRRQFDRSISQFQLVRQKIAQMTELNYAMEAMTYLAAGMVDRKEKDLMLETAITKLFTSEMSWQVVDDAVQLWAGEGYMREHGLERMLRDARINRIVEGTTEVMTSFVALVGLKGVGEELDEVLQSIKRPIANFGRLAEFAKHEWRDVLIGHVNNGALTQVHKSLAPEAQQLARLTRKLARSITRVLAKYQTRIIDQQLVQERIAWSVIELYATAAVIAKLQAQIERGGSNGEADQLARDLTVGKAYCKHAADRITRRLEDLFRNGDKQTLAVADAVLGKVER